MKNALLCSLILMFFAFCSQQTQVSEKELDPNPPAKGFNEKASDIEAIAWADGVMQKMGGRKGWDETRYIKWNFFGARKLLWDKQTGWVRIEDQRSDLKINVNINSNPLEGSVYKNGTVFTDTDSLSFYLDRGNRIWINDSYWLVMPYKLKDSGVALTYAGEDATQQGQEAHKLRLTFDKVGVTPQNAYDVWIGKTDTLVRQWAYYQNASDSLPMFTMPWNEYQQYGDILLSGNRGERELSDIEVLDEVDPGLFYSFDQGI